jgi:hypothetical protein
MYRIALSAMLLLANWPAQAAASEAIKYGTASASWRPRSTGVATSSGTAKAPVARKIGKHSTASGHRIILGIAY